MNAHCGRSPKPNSGREERGFTRIAFQRSILSRRQPSGAPPGCDACRNLCSLRGRRGRLRCKRRMDSPALIPRDYCPWIPAAVTRGDDSTWLLPVVARAHTTAAASPRADRSHRSSIANASSRNPSLAAPTGVEGVGPSGDGRRSDVCAGASEPPGCVVAQHALSAVALQRPCRPPVEAHRGELA